ncbi:MAG: hypothetical protein R3B90_02710 [Planctomycetaceae bacterium]
MRVREFEEQSQDRLRAAREAELARSEQVRACESRAAELEAEQRALARARLELDAERANYQAALDDAIERDREELRQQRAGFDLTRKLYEQEVVQWEAERSAAQAKLAEQSAQLAQERIDLEKRTRFHHDHLERLRAELAEQRADLERDRQRQRVWKEQVEESIRLRFAHIRRFRELVEEREESLARAEQTVRDDRRDLERQVAARHRELDQQSEAFRLLEARELAAIKRQKELLNANASLLESRRGELDRQRVEAEQKQRELLEQSMAFEQARAEYADEAGQEEAGHRYERARKALLEFHQQLETSHAERRLELQGLIRQIHEKRSAFREEREVAADRLHERELDAERRETRLRTQIIGLHEREHRWQLLREHWRREKAQAEEIIRSLVVKLEQLLEADGGPPVHHGAPEELDDTTAAAA